MRTMSGICPDAAGTETASMPSFFFSISVRALYPSFCENTLATCRLVP
jgi:hypothetical protein